MLCFQHFNSTIVRLKHFALVDQTRVIKFQFYNSPIKTDKLHIDEAGGTEFQFYNSPIKTFLFDVQYYNAVKFQFYNSPIKTWW